MGAHDCEWWFANAARGSACRNSYQGPDCRMAEDALDAPGITCEVTIAGAAEGAIKNTRPMPACPGTP